MKKVIIAALILIVLWIPISNLFLYAILPRYSVEPTVFAVYYGWYQQNDWNQEQLPDGITYEPTLGTYDSQSPEVIAQHLSWAQQAGIDVLVVEMSRADETIRIMLSQIEDSQLEIKICALYGGHEVEELEYILENYGSSPAYFKVDGKPVIFIWSQGIYGGSHGTQGIGAELFQNIDWSKIAPQFEEKAVLIGDINFKSILAPPPHFLCFDAYFTFNPSVVTSRLEHPTFIASFFKLFLYTRPPGSIRIATVLPGYDDSHQHDRMINYQIDREGGAFYQRQWEGALKADPDWVFINSFNEWYEQTVIEPSPKYGNLYLNITADYSLKFKQGHSGGINIEEFFVPYPFYFGLPLLLAAFFFFSYLATKKIVARKYGNNKNKDLL